MVGCWWMGDGEGGYGYAWMQRTQRKLFRNPCCLGPWLQSSARLEGPSPIWTSGYSAWGPPPAAARPALVPPHCLTDGWEELQHPIEKKPSHLGKAEHRSGSCLEGNISKQLLAATQHTPFWPISLPAQPGKTEISCKMATATQASGMGGNATFRVLTYPVLLLDDARSRRALD